jgi:hypothetical protein
VNKGLRLWAAPLRVSEAFQRTWAQSTSPSIATAGSGFAHRADSGDAIAATDVFTKLVVVLLSSVNAVMWWVYTESRLMGTVWAITAICFAVWMKRDAARR